MNLEELHLDCAIKQKKGIIPTILGKGRPLFLGNNPTIPLHLDKYTVSDGIAVFYYSKR